MRASVVLLFAFLALAFVAAYAAVEQKETDDPSLAVNEDSDEASAAAPVSPPLPSGAKGTKQSRGYNNGCYCYYWLPGFYIYTRYGCISHGHRHHHRHRHSHRHRNTNRHRYRNSEDVCDKRLRHSAEPG
ncbi:hypothetical protein LSAT2_020480 [Lamellibrachia satsuma]|nr:hypothetical protein LSAT2_020480 [Lamellibrachia satsuma]